MDQGRTGLALPAEGRRFGGRALARPSLSQFLAATGLLTAMLTARPFVADPDFWWHIRNGDTLIATNHLIHVNPYAFMAAGHHWVMQEWLSEMWMAAAAAFDGRLGVILVYELITVALLVLIWLRALELGPAHGLTLGAGALLAGLVSYPIFGPRDQMESYLLTALVLLLVERQLRRGDRWARSLPAIFLLWSNLHAGFILGLIFLWVIAAIEAVLAVAGQRPPEQRGRLRALVLVTVLSTLACLVNPNGVAIVLYPFQTQFSSAQQSLIQEWHSPNFHVGVLLPLLAFAVSLPYLCLRYRRLTARDAAILVLSLLLALQSVRQAVVLVAAAMPVWINLAEQARQELSRRWRARPRLRQPGLIIAAELAELAALLTILTAQVAAGGSPGLDSRAYVSSFPVCAARWLDSAPAHLRIFNQYGDGGFLIYTVPKDKVFIFGDAALMGSPLLRRYASIVDLGPSWLDSLNRSPSQLVLFERGNAFSSALQKEPSWTLVYRDRRVQVFERSSLLASLRLPPNPTAQYWRNRRMAACVGQAQRLPGRAQA